MNIYALHSGDYVYKYVGATTLAVNERLRLHKQKARRGSNARVHRWIRENLSKVQIQLLEVTELEFAEAKWIAILDTHLHGLNNHPKGVGCTLPMNRPKKIKQRLSAEEKSIRISEGRRKSVDKRAVCLQCGLKSTLRGVRRHQSVVGHDGVDEDRSSLGSLYGKAFG